MRTALGLLFVSAACGAAPSHGSLASLTTIGESSRYVRTGRYDEVLRLCRAFAAARADVSCDEIGVTGQGRPIVALRIERTPGAPTIVVQAGIHAGEIEGKDAGFAFVRDLLAGTVARGALDAVSIVFIPVINPDGHERFGPNHRGNQRGPEEMGFRTNGARLNLNRDFMKLDTPEIRAAVRVLRDRDPVLFVDLHTTDGAKFEHDIALDVGPAGPRGDTLDATTAALRDRVVARVAQLGHLPTSFYPMFRTEDDPSSGFERGEVPPRFGTYYQVARGRMALLVETHSWRTYRERATSTYHALQAVFELAATEASAWQRAAASTKQRDAALAGTRVPLIWRADPTRSHEIEFRGYAYTRAPSELSGAPWIAYDETTPERWRVPMFDTLAPALTVAAPRGGYVVDGGFAAAVAPLLDAHGIAYTRIAGEPRIAAEVFRPRTVALQQPTVEGRTRVELAGAWTPEPRTLERGALFVPIAQPFARVVLHLLEPTAPDSLAQWGLFNACFEQKEYLESYVVEEAARAMLAKDPGLRAQFDAALAADPELAKSPARRLRWFAERHPAWDERLGLLPVFRVDQPLSR